LHLKPHSPKSSKPAANSVPPPHPATAISTHRSRAKSKPRQSSPTDTPTDWCSRRTITFIDKDSQSHTFTVADGANLLDIAQANDLEMEGACGGSCACSTCHVIVEDEALYDKMTEPDDDENDMLDLAFGLTETSRLGCQVVMSKELDGLVVKLPRITRNLQASDFK
jgi:ferredoxin